jgi:hypothetical protein
MTASAQPVAPKFTRDQLDTMSESELDRLAINRLWRDIWNNDTPVPAKPESVMSWQGAALMIERMSSLLFEYRFSAGKYHHGKFAGQYVFIATFTYEPASWPTSGLGFGTSMASAVAIAAILALQEVT